MANDSTYAPNVYRKSGGDEMVVDSGGKITQATGGAYVHPLRTATGPITMVAGESGVTVISQTVGNIFTLPASTSAGAGVRYTFVAGTGALATAGVNAIKIRPQSTDKILGATVVASMSDGDVLTLAGANDTLADHVTVQSDGNLGYYVIAREGTWTRTTAT